MPQDITLPPFTLYNIGNDCSKSCYESQNLTILCNISVPYFDRNKTSIDPTINCAINGTSLKDEQAKGICEKVRQIINLVLVKDKYLRMNFDLEYHVVEIKDQQDLFPAMINLLCFTLVLAGVQIKSLFSCSQAWLKEEKIMWSKGSKDKENGGNKKMILVLESDQKEIVYSQFQGEFVFVHFQRLSNILMDANEQIHSYIIKKIGEINDQLQN